MLAITAFVSSIDLDPAPPMIRYYFARTIRGGLRQRRRPCNRPRLGSRPWMMQQAAGRPNELSTKKHAVLCLLLPSTP